MECFKNGAEIGADFTSDLIDSKDSLEMRPAEGKPKENPNASLVQDSSWLFNALWNACSSSSSSSGGGKGGSAAAAGPAANLPSSATLSSSSAGAQRRRCTARIPITLLFKKGVCHRALHTDSTGCLARLDIEALAACSAARAASRHQNDIGGVPRDPVDRNLRGVYIALFGDDDDGAVARDGGAAPPSCRVYYSDGTIDHLTAESFSSLLQNRQFRAQVTMVQQQTQTQIHLQEEPERVDGFYSAKRQARPKQLSSPSPALADAADRMLEALVDFATAAYGGNISIREAYATFEVRAGGAERSLFFVNSDRVYVEILSRRREVEAALEDERRARDLSAAYEVSKELTSLLAYSAKRNVSIEDTFNHFDTSGGGFVDVDAFIDGLSRLGIGTTRAVGDAMVQIIGGVGAPFFHLHHLKAYVDRNTKDNKSDMEILKVLRRKRKTATAPTASAQSTSKGSGMKENSLVSDNSLIGGSTAEFEIEESNLNSRFVGIGAENAKAALTSKVIEMQGKIESRRSKAMTSAKTPSVTTRGASAANSSERGDARSEKSAQSRRLTKVSSRGMKRLETARSAYAVEAAEPVSTEATVGDKASTDLMGAAAECSVLQNEQLLADSDEVLHIDGGVTMTYRIEGAALSLKQAPTRQLTRGNSLFSMLGGGGGGSFMLDRKSSFGDLKRLFSNVSEVSKPEEAEGATKSTGSMVVVIVVPDVFTTLETMNRALQPLIKGDHPVRLVIAGLPGSRHTHWPRGWTLDSDFHARSILSLVLYFHETQKLGSSKDPIIMIGFGTGAYAMYRFLSIFMKYMSWFSDRLKAVVQINGFVNVNDELRNRFKDLRKALLSANAVEVDNIVMSLLFSQRHVSGHDRAACLDSFWSSRRKLSFADSDSEKPQDGSTYIGLLEQLRGLVMDKFDMTLQQSFFGTSSVPAFIIHGSDNIFIQTGAVVEHYSDQSLGPINRHTVSNMSGAFEPGAVYIGWVQGGHELLEERPGFVVALLTSIVEHLHPKRSEAGNAELEHISDDENPFADGIVSEDGDDDQANLMENTEEGDIFSSDILKRDSSEPNGKETSNADTGDRTQAIVSSESEIGASESQGTIDDRRPTQGRITRQSSMFDKRKEAEEQRKAELAALEMKQKQYQERKQELLESTLMAAEDEASKKLSIKEVIEAQDAVLKERRVRQQLDNLYSSNRDEVLALVEEKTKKIKQEKLDAFRLEHDMFLRKIEVEEALILDLNRYKKADTSANTVETARTKNHILSKVSSGSIAEKIKNAYLLFKDILLGRQELIQALKRERDVDKAVKLFRSEKYSLEVEFSGLKRALRTFSIHKHHVAEDTATMNRDEGLELSRREIEETRKAVEMKEKAMHEFHRVGMSKEKQLRQCKKVVYLCFQNVENRELKFSEYLKEFQVLEKELLSHLKKIRFNKESLEISRDKQIFNKKLTLKRLERIGAELNRMQKHKAEYVDTDVLFEGVMQRAKTTTAKAFLENENEKLKRQIENLEVEINKIHSSIIEVNLEISSIAVDYEKIALARTCFLRAISDYRKRNCEDEMLEWIEAQRDAVEKDQKRRDMRKHMTQVEMIEFLDGKIHSDLASKTRSKAIDLRTPLDRQFIAVDLVLHPEVYRDLSSVEINEMKLHSDYKCPLKRSDIERIKKLPEVICLALPFLHTPAEVNMHKIINMYYRGKGPEFFETKDKESLASLYASKDSRSKGQVVGDSESAAKKESAEQEAKLEILLREFDRDSVRSAVGDLEAEERLTEDEQNWIQLDRILSPALYSLEIDGGLSRPASSSSRRDSALLARSTSKTFVPFSNSFQYEDDGVVDPFASVAKLLSEDQSKRPTSALSNWSSNSDTFSTAVVRGSLWQNYSREKLFAIRNTTEFPLLNSEELYCRKLLDRFYISEDESYLSDKRLKIIQVLARALCNFIRKQESISKEQEKALLERSNSMAQSKVFEEEIKFNRVWGSWEQVHPASAGASSQQKYFLVAGFDPSRDHPAAYATRFDRSDPFDDDAGLFDEEDDATASDGKNNLVSEEEKREQAKQLILGQNMPSKEDGKGKLEESSYHIVTNLEELAGLDYRAVRNKVVYIAQKESSTLFELLNQTLEARQSRSHRFEIQDRADARALDITVSVLFQGYFGDKGYRFGRLAANLFRLSKKSSGESDNTASLPLPVGYCPYELQAPNTPEHFGRIVIVHKPEVQPLPAGTYQIIIGCASDVKYSIHVACRVAKTALPILDEAISKAKVLQMALPKCIRELEDITVGLRLGKSKLAVCNQLIAESEMEANHFEKEITAINDKITEDDELLIMSDEERKKYKKDLSKLETEFAKNAAIFSSRQLEREHIKDGIRQISSIQKQKIAEKNEMRAKLETARWTLPSCMALLRSVGEASQVAISLNTTLQTKVQDSAAGKEGDSSSVFGQQFCISTPADQLRRLFRSDDVKLLTVEQQQWILLDQTLNPQLYEWQAEKLEEENARRRLEGKNIIRQKSFGAAVESVRLSKYEIERILLQPFSLLSRKEAKVRKLLSKYHDNPEAIKRNFILNLSGFNPNLAESVRIKMTKGMSSEEKEWMSLDKVLNPEIWSYYTNELLTYKSDVLNTLDASDQSKSAPRKTTDAKKALRSNKKNGKNRLNAINEEATDANNKEERSSVSSEKAKELWRCPFDKETLLRIWKGAQVNTPDEKYAMKLLHKYNGSYHSYVQANEESQHRTLNHPKTGLIKWKEHGTSISRDVDERAREVLKELDRAAANKQFWMDSRILHSKDQRFPTATVRQQLQEELDNILKEQIKERERVDKYLASLESSEDEDDDLEICLREPEISTDEDVDTNDATKSSRAARQAQKKVAAKEKKKLLKEQQGQIVSSFRTKQKISGINDEVARNKFQESKTSVQSGWCLACRSPKCNWRPMCDEELLVDRVNKLTLELERVRSDPESHVFVSDVALGAQLGGSNVYTKYDLMEELSNERIELSRRIELNQLDKEFHDIINTKKEYVEVKHLHGYTTVMWTSNARRALAQRQDHLVAVNTAHDVIDGILDWMLDGWYFGQRESASLVAGYVPSIRKNGFIRPGQDQIAFEPVVLEKIKERISAQKQGTITSTTMRGRSLDRIIPIFEKVEVDNLEKELKKLKEDGAHTLDETETTLKFGMFMLTFMYFRAMAYITREKRSWSGADDAVGGGGGASGARLTEERRRIIDETFRRAVRKQRMDVAIKMAYNGAERKRMREETKKRDAMLKMLEAYRKYKKELLGILLIQRVYRGYVGRKAAFRWAIKRAEMDAFTKIMTSAALIIQRIWRGYLGRSIARERKQEMAYYIAMVRLQESENDEAEYWKLHSFAKYRRDLKKKVKNKLFDEDSKKVLGANSLGKSGFLDEK